MKKKYARYGPSDRYDSPPGAGMCLSVFALVQKEGYILLGIPKKARRWRDDWLYSKRKNEGLEIFEEWRLPSCYLKEGEDPRAALDRIMVEELGVKRYTVSPNTPRVFSYYSPSDWYPKRNHWDFALIYNVKLPQAATPKNVERYWSKLDFHRTGKDLKSMKFGWNFDLIADLNLF